MWIVDQARQSAIAAIAGTNGPNHWVLVNKIDTKGGKVSVVRYSYGTKAATCSVDADVFFQVYGGFIAVCELDPAAANASWR